MLCDDRQSGMKGGGREAQKGGDKCIIIVDSRCCTAETNTTLFTIILPLKINSKASLVAQW